MNVDTVGIVRSKAAEERGARRRRQRNKRPRPPVRENGRSHFVPPRYKIRGAGTPASRPGPGHTAGRGNPELRPQSAVRVTYRSSPHVKWATSLSPESPRPSPAG